jgi:transcriptional regulator with XRE-family HTH domain
MLRKLRQERGSSLRATARDLKVDPSYLSRLERGEKPASREVLRRASSYYDVPFEEFELAKGNIPEDVVDILRRNPGLVEKLRDQYGSV